MAPPSTLDQTLARVQGASGLVATAFVLGHVAGHSLAVLRFDWANSALLAFRK
ncbi:hypothetical protein HK405_014179, partial [Cladochytrium tenue]